MRSINVRYLLTYLLTYLLHDGQPSPSVPRAVGPGPSLAACANRAINGLPIHAVVRHLFKQGLTTERL